MTPSTSTIPDSLGRLHPSSGDRISTSRAMSSGVSWGAVIAGASAAASMSLILLILGVGLGLSSVSPWVRDGVSAKTFGVSTIVWLTVTQLLSSGVGGYLAGRLRTKWTEIHSDEVYFRDTAHGFLAWAVASLVTATLLTSVIGSIIGSGVQAGAAVASGVVNPSGPALSGVVGSATGNVTEGGNSLGYMIDSLFRHTAPSADPKADSKVDSVNPAASSAASQRPVNENVSEISRIFMNLKFSDPLPPDDLKYVGQLVAQRTGLNQQVAEKRVSDLYGKAQAKARDSEIAAREAADKARKASAYAALWLFVSLLIGAFVASLSATYGGRRRDA
jgi:hypothetical protein